MKDRLKQVIDYYDITTNSFSQKIGVSEGAIRKVLLQNTTLRSDTLDKISQNFTDINIDWLVTGRGEMLRKDNTTITANSDENVSRLITILENTLKEKDSQINRLLSIIENKGLK
jgi:transcriptional regulator with XRE-family HTH domain